MEVHLWRRVLPLILTCSAGSFTASSINWIKSDTNKDLNRKIESKTTKGNGSASLTISNMTPELSGQYKCIATNKNKIIMKTIHVKCEYIFSYLLIMNKILSSLLLHIWRKFLFMWVYCGFDLMLRFIFSICSWSKNFE